MTTTDDHTTSSQAYRAKRVQSLRKALNLSRRQFNNIFAIPIGTLQHWENQGDACGLSEKGAHTLSHALRTWNIRVTPEWLLHGIGAKPALPAKFQQLPSLSVTTRGLSSTIEQELALFHKLHDDVIDLVVPDDSMHPYIFAGDHVAGVKYMDNDIAEALDQDCIILTDTHEMLIRHVCEGHIPGCYTLKSRNFHTSAPKPVLYDVKLLCAAPIMWIRRNN